MHDVWSSIKSSSSQHLALNRPPLVFGMHLRSCIDHLASRHSRQNAAPSSPGSRWHSCLSIRSLSIHILCAPGSSCLKRLPTTRIYNRIREGESKIFAQWTPGNEAACRASCLCHHPQRTHSSLFELGSQEKDRQPFLALERTEIAVCQSSASLGLNFPLNPAFDFTRTRGRV